MKSKARAIFGFGLLFSLLLFLWGCNPGTISGTVIDEITGKPVAGAQVTIGSKSTETSTTGSYQITGIPVGSHTLKVTAPGYQEYTEELQVKQGAQIVDISLTPISTATPTAPGEPAPSTEEVVGPEGGTIVGPSEVKLSIPTQALAEKTVITIKQIADPPPPPTGTSFASPAYEINLSPGPELLASLAKLTLPLLPEALEQRDEKTLLTVVYWDGAEWVPLGGEVDEQSGTITVEVRHFSSFSVLRRILPIIPLTTEHFKIIPFLALPSGYTIEQLGERLEKAWALIIDKLGYETPIQSKMGWKIQVWIVPWESGGRVGGTLESIRERLLAYANYDIHLGSTLKGNMFEVTPAHEFFHIVQINSYLHPRQIEELGPVLWWMEATATWIGAKSLNTTGKYQENQEYKRFYEYERTPFLELPLDSNKGYHRYLAATFVRYLEWKYGADIIKDTWKLLGLKRPPLEAIDKVLKKQGTTLSDAYFDFAQDYGYLRSSPWLSAFLPQNEIQEPSSHRLVATTSEAEKTLALPHLSGGAFQIVPAGGVSGTLKFGFDWSRSDDVWRVRLFVEKKAGDVTSVDIAPTTQEYEVASFGEDVKGVVIVAANTSLAKDSTSLRFSYQIVIPTADTTPPEVTITSAPHGEIDYNNVTFKWTGHDNQTETTDLVYSYHLEGHDRTWSDWTLGTSKEYSGLPDGSYTFRVKAKDQAGNVTLVASEVVFAITKQGYSMSGRVTAIASLERADLEGILKKTGADKVIESLGNVLIGAGAIDEQVLILGVILGIATEIEEYQWLKVKGLDGWFKANMSLEISQTEVNWIDLVKASLQKGHPGLYASIKEALIGLAAGSSLAGVTVTLSGDTSATTTTDRGGNYSFSGLQNGSYVITLSKSGYTFNPPDRSITISGSDVSGQNFTATTAQEVTPLPGGVILGSYSIAIFKVERSKVPNPLGGKWEVTRLWFAFRRVSGPILNWEQIGEQQLQHGIPTEWTGRGFTIRITDDRGNKYSWIISKGGAQSRFDGFPVSDCVSGKSISYQGRPSGKFPLTIPHGFTWISPIDIDMPKVAPVESIEVSLCSACEDWHPISVSPHLPELWEPDPDVALGFGQELKLDENLSVRLGEIVFTEEPRGYFYRLSLPIFAKNIDYNTRLITIHIDVQFNDGMVCLEWPLGYSIVGWEGTKWIKGLSEDTFYATLKIRSDQLAKERLLSMRLLKVVFSTEIPQHGFQTNAVRYIRVTPGDILVTVDSADY